MREGRNDKKAADFNSYKTGRNPEDTASPKLKRRAAAAEKAEQEAAAAKAAEEKEKDDVLAARKALKIKKKYAKALRQKTAQKMQRKKREYAIKQQLEEDAIKQQLEEDAIKQQLEDSGHVEGEDIRYKPGTKASGEDALDADRKNSHEAFAGWFNENIRSLDDIEAAGEDLLVVSAAWCAANNHEIRADGVYNMNIQPSKK